MSDTVGASISSNTVVLHSYYSYVISCTSSILQNATVQLAFVLLQQGTGLPLTKACCSHRRSVSKKAGLEDKNPGARIPLYFGGIKHRRALLKTCSHHLGPTWSPRNRCKDHFMKEPLLARITFSFSLSPIRFRAVGAAGTGSFSARRSYRLGMRATKGKF